MATADAEDLAIAEAYWEVEPFGDWWRAAAQVSSSAMQAAGMKKKTGGEITPDDVLKWNIPGYAPHDERPAMDEQEIEQALARALKGTDG